MQIPPPQPSNPKHEAAALAAAVEVERRVTQDTHEREYQQALVTIKEKIREIEGPDMKETMMDQIRQWFIECRWAPEQFWEDLYQKKIVGQNSQK